MERDGHIKRVDLFNVGPFPQATMDSIGIQVSLEGPNDSGKSIILEAMSAVLLGQGLDKDYIHKNPHADKQAKEANVSVEFYDGRRVEMGFTASTTKWSLIHPDGHIESLSGKRDKGIAKKIQEFTGFGEVKVDSSQTLCLNIMGLNDPNFLMDGRNPMSVLALINTYAGHGVLEDAHKLAVSSTGKCTQRITVAETEAEKLRQRRRDLNTAEAKERKEKLSILVEKLEKLKRCLEESSYCRELRSSMLALAKEKVAIRDEVDRLEKFLQPLEQKMNEWSLANQLKAQAESSLERVTQTAEALREAEKALKTAENKVEEAAGEMSEWLGSFVPDKGSFSLCRDCGCVKCEEKKK